MASTLSSKKRIRQNARARALNRWRLRSMRASVKAFQTAVASGDKSAASSAMREASKIVDRTAQKGVIHRNQASRRKSRMNARLRAMG